MSGSDVAVRAGCEGSNPLRIQRLYRVSRMTGHVLKCAELQAASIEVQAGRGVYRLSAHPQLGSRKTVWVVTCRNEWRSGFMGFTQCHFEHRITEQDR